MNSREIIDELRELRDRSEMEYKSAQSYGFRMEKKGEVTAYKTALRLLGAI